MSNGLSVSVEYMRYPGDKCSLIEELSFTVPHGKFVSILGRSGVGKTTLLRIIAGIESRYRGRVSLDDVPVMGPNRDIRMVFQDFRLIPWKTVYENIWFAVGDGDARKGRADIERWLSIVGLEDKKSAWPKTLSGGEQGRVAFARAFIEAPRVLLLDEPFRGLDLVTKFDLQEELVRDLEEQDSAVVLVSHSIEDAVFLSDIVYVLTDVKMQIAQEFAVECERPRKHGDKYLSDLTAEIARFICFETPNGRSSDKDSGIV